MNFAATFEHHVGDEIFRFRPLTVRERIGLSNAIIEREKKKAIQLANELSLSGSEKIESVQKAIADAEKVSSVVMSCFTFDGCIAVLRLAAEDQKSIDRLAEVVEPGELSVIAARCLNVEIENPSSRRDTNVGN